MFTLIDNFLNRVTMYRLVHYSLIVLLCIAGVFGFFGLLPYSPFAIATSSVFLVIICWVTNKIFSNIFKAPTSSESYYITALILACILSPIISVHSLPLFIWAGVLSMSSKYILAINKKHIFNPVAISVVLTSFGFGSSASWWVGNSILMPFIILGGLLIVRKIKRWDLVFSFLIVAVITTVALGLLRGTSITLTINQLLLNSALFFFAFVMLTEPMTTPPTKFLQILYGGLVGFLFSPQIHLGSIYSTPELALVIGNVFSYLVSPKQKLLLYLSEKRQLGSNIIDFIFTSSRSMVFTPGQYMEWTLPHKGVDSRGNRRYFTIASSPTEDNLRLGIRFSPKSSSFKQKMINMDESTPIVAGQLAGDFTLPKNPHTKLVFIAGGIGITPFRSMAKYLIDNNEKRDIVLLYSNKNISEIAYEDVFEEARNKLSMKTIFTLTDQESIPRGWSGKVGKIDAKTIQEEVPDYQNRIFYLSGPQAMVKAFDKTLKEMGIPPRHIKKDFFPGFV